jgi:hypothetical protein
MCPNKLNNFVQIFTHAQFVPSLLGYLSLSHSYQHQQNPQKYTH